MSALCGEQHKGPFHGGLCGHCGGFVEEADMVGLVPLVGSGIDQVGLQVSREYANTIAGQDNSRLMASKKLVLVLDLDKTLIHTTSMHLRMTLHEQMPHAHLSVADQIAEQWIREGVEGIASFRISGDSPTYYTRCRPGLDAFLKAMKEKFELHVYTMGTRPYAKKIVEIIDPKGEFFSTRLLTKDESFSVRSKSMNLEALFPGGDHMAVIVDDLPVVWDFRENLIPAVPYEYFKSVEEVNAVPQQSKEKDATKRLRQIVVQRMSIANHLHPTPNLVSLLEEAVQHIAPADSALLWARALAFVLVVELRRAFDWSQPMCNACIAMARELKFSSRDTEELRNYGEQEQLRLEELLKSKSYLDSIPQAEAKLEAEMASHALEALMQDSELSFSLTQDRNGMTQDSKMAAAHQKNKTSRLPVYLHMTLRASSPWSSDVQMFKTLVANSCSFLQKTIVDESYLSGTLGSWLGDIIKHHNISALKQVIEGKAFYMDNLEALLLLKAAQQLKPSPLWPSGQPPFRILKRILSSGQRIERRLHMDPPHDTDGVLTIIEHVLCELWELYFSPDLDAAERDTRLLLPSVRLNYTGYQPWALAGCRIVLTGVVPHGTPKTKTEIYQKAILLGAVLHDELDDEVTHLVARAKGTSKYNEAFQYPGTKIVHMEWIRACFRLGKKIPESEFPLAGAPLVVPLSQQTGHTSMSTEDMFAAMDKEMEELSSDEDEDEDEDIEGDKDQDDDEEGDKEEDRQHTEAQPSSAAEQQQQQQPPLELRAVKLGAAKRAWQSETGESSMPHVRKSAYGSRLAGDEDDDDASHDDDDASHDEDDYNEDEEDGEDFLA